MKLLNYKFKWPATVLFYTSLLIGIYLISTENHLNDIWNAQVYSLFGNEKGVIGSEFGKRGWTENSLFNEVLTVVIICSGLIASFSREIIEDELISKIRLESLSIAIITNYALVLVSNFFIFDFAFFNTLVIFLFAPLVMFNIIFQVRLFNYYKVDNEK
jgi:hypothetical protein